MNINSCHNFKKVANFSLNHSNSKPLWKSEFVISNDELTNTNARRYYFLAHYGINMAGPKSFLASKSAWAFFASIKLYSLEILILIFPYFTLSNIASAPA